MTLTVAELIERLRDLPQDLPVLVYEPDGDMHTGWVVDVTWAHEGFQGVGPEALIELEPYPG